MLARTGRHQILLKYIIVGASAFIVEYVSFTILFKLFGLHTLAANTVSFCLGLLTSFLAQRAWTFASKDREYARHIKHQIILYGVLSIVNFAISTATIELLVHVGLLPLVAKLGTMLVVAFWNYFVMRRIIFTIET